LQRKDNAVIYVGIQSTVTWCSNIVHIDWHVAYLVKDWWIKAIQSMTSSMLECGITAMGVLLLENRLLGCS
jgi:hypothetical protein